MYPVVTTNGVGRPPTNLPQPRPRLALDQRHRPCLHQPAPRPRTNLNVATARTTTMEEPGQSVGRCPTHDPDQQALAIGYRQCLAGLVKHEVSAGRRVHCGAEVPGGVGGAVGCRLWMSRRGSRVSRQSVHDWLVAYRDGGHDLPSPTSIGSAPSTRSDRQRQLRLWAKLSLSQRRVLISSACSSVGDLVRSLACWLWTTLGG